MSGVETNSYVINEADDIVSVGPEWDRFAVENDAPRAMAKNVIGRKIWDFIDGFETSSYLNAIFYACRMDTESFDILYRCDAPEVQRLFRLSICPEEKGWLTLNHALVHNKKRLQANNVAIFTDHFDNTRCSVCCSFLVGENWIDTFSHLNDRYFPKSYSVCPTCRENTRKKLDSMKRKDGSDDVVKFHTRKSVKP